MISLIFLKTNDIQMISISGIKFSSLTTIHKFHGEVIHQSPFNLNLIESFILHQYI